MIKLKSQICDAHVGCREKQFRETFLDIENCQLDRLDAKSAIEPRSTFCISERYIAGLTPVKFLEELTTNYMHTN